MQAHQINKAKDHTPELTARFVLSLMAVALLLLLAACGLHPVYGAKSAQSAEKGARELEKIRVNVVSAQGFINNRSRSDFAELQLSQELERQLDPLYHRPTPEYELKTAISTQNQGVAIQPDGTALRYNLALFVDYTLIDQKTGKTLYKGRSRLRGGYDKVDSEYATYVAEEDTLRRLVREVATLIRRDLIAVFKQEKYLQEPDPLYEEKIEKEKELQDLYRMKE